MFTMLRTMLLASLLLALAAPGVAARQPAANGETSAPMGGRCCLAGRRKE